MASPAPPLPLRIAITGLIPCLSILSETESLPDTHRVLFPKGEFPILEDPRYGGAARNASLGPGREGRQA